MGVLLCLIGSQCKLCINNVFDVGTLTYKYNIFFLVEVQLWVWLKIGHCFNFDKFNVLVVHVVIYYIGIITRYFEIFIYQLLLLFW